MPWSKRKPYVYDEDQRTPAGRIRSSLGDFFRAPVRHLKESNEKESQFEKPYRGGSYNKMHLDLPWPKFRRGEDRIPGSIFGDMPSLTHTFFFDEGLCSFTGGGELEVGEWKRVSGFMSLTPPQSGAGEWLWTVVSSHSEIEINILEHGKSPKVEVRALAEFEGTALVCAECGYSGALVDSYTMEKAGVGFVDLQLFNNQWNFIDRNTSLPVEGGVETTYRDGSKVTCGCVEFTYPSSCSTVTPVSFRAYGVNPETIIRSNSVTLTVQDGLGPYTWSVSGTGFSIAALTSGTSNSLIADGTACGTATVTVTDFCGNSDTYEVRCTTGSWSGWSGSASCQLTGGIYDTYLGTGPPCSGANRGFQLTQGKYRQAHCLYNCQAGYVYCTTPWCTSNACLSNLNCAAFGEGTTTWNNGVMHCSSSNKCYGKGSYYYRLWGC